MRGSASMVTMLDRVGAFERTALRNSFADFERAVLQDNIVLCDGKSGVLLAFGGAMVLFCLDTLAGLHGARGVDSWRYWGKVGLFLAAAAGFLVSCHFSLATVLPRFRRRRADHIFWESAVFKLSADAYVERMQSLDPSTEQTDKLRHLHALAGICSAKFKHFQLAMRVAQGAFGLLVLAELARIAA